MSAAHLALYIVKLLQGHDIRRLSDPEDSGVSKAPLPVKPRSQSALQSGTPVLIPAAVTPVVERFLQARTTCFALPSVCPPSSHIHILFAARLPSKCPRHACMISPSWQHAVGRRGRNYRRTTSNACAACSAYRMSVAHDACALIGNQSMMTAHLCLTHVADDRAKVVLCCTHRMLAAVGNLTYSSLQQLRLGTPCRC